MARTTEAVETHRRSVGILAALALAGLIGHGCAHTPYLGTTSASYMGHARDSEDPNLRLLAYQKLGNPNCYDNDNQRADAATFLGKRLVEGQEPTITRAVICQTLGALGRPEGRDALTHACDDTESVVRAAACRALGKIGDAEDVAVLSRIMAADLDGDCKIAAIEGLGQMKAADHSANQTLIAGMESTDPAIRLASYEALKHISRRDFGPDPKAWREALDPADLAGVQAVAAGDRGTPNATIGPQ